MPSAAERYAAATQRNAHPQLTSFAADYPFGLDAFQLEAGRAIEAGKSVLVAAPTGAGKTVVGEFAIALALHAGTKAFYTTPIKALSNQKYHELVERYGEDRVGLLTGDNTINGEAQIVVMTTEVLRNMLYAKSSTLHDLEYVVMDEVHYLADRFRGAVWEEVIIHLPDRVQVVALSATVSNAEEFGAWLTAVRGDTEIVVEEHRPVPLWQHVMAGTKLYDLFVDDDQTVVNPELVRLAREDDRASRLRTQRPARGKRRPRSQYTPYRTDVIDRLARDRLLPVIFFIFSRAACNDAVRQCIDSGIRLTSREEKAEILRVVAQRTASIPEEDLAVLGYSEWVEGLGRGIAAHHAGMLPTFKEIVEELFQRGLIQVVFATETLALGINMPARSVVLEKLVKWNGQTHVDITPGEYTQLTGRAGRRGIDIEGHGIALWHPGMEPGALAGLASTRTYPLRSSFAPTYNMAVNLVSSLGVSAAREVLETSFAQFQADAAVVGLARQVRKNEESMAQYSESMQCHLGDMVEYSKLRRELSDREKSAVRDANARNKRDTLQALAELKPGDIIVVPSGRRSGPVLVLDPGLRDPTDPRPMVLTLERQVRRISSNELSAPAQPIARMRIPKSFNARSPHSRRDLTKAFADRVGELEIAKPRRSKDRSDDDQITALRTKLRQHPVHGCSDREDHARWAERYERISKENEALTARIEGRTSSVGKRFDRVVGVLTDTEYLAGHGDDLVVTAAGEMLRHLYTESDLLAAECVRRGVWNELTPVQLASVVSTLVFESRVSEENEAPKVPSAVRDVLADMVQVWSDIHEREHAHGLEITRPIDLGFTWPLHRWASGSRLETVLAGSDLTAGDFVRTTKMVIDLLGQLAQLDSPIATTARTAADLIARGVVTYSSVDQ